MAFSDVCSEIPCQWQFLPTLSLGGQTPVGLYCYCAEHIFKAEWTDTFQPGTCASVSFSMYCVLHYNLQSLSDMVVTDKSRWNKLCPGGLSLLSSFLSLFSLPQTKKLYQRYNHAHKWPSSFAIANPLCQWIVTFTKLIWKKLDNFYYPLLLWGISPLH